MTTINKALMVVIRWVNLKCSMCNHIDQHVQTCLEAGKQAEHAKHRLGLTLRDIMFYNHKTSNSFTST